LPKGYAQRSAATVTKGGPGDLIPALVCCFPFRNTHPPSPFPFITKETPGYFFSSGNFGVQLTILSRSSVFFFSYPLSLGFFSQLLSRMLRTV